VINSLNQYAGFFLFDLAYYLFDVSYKQSKNNYLALKMQFRNKNF